MSTANLLKFLEYLVDDLKAKDVTFRTSVANRNEHIFATSSKRILTQTVKELKLRNIRPTTKEMAVLTTGASKAYRLIRQKIDSSLRRHEKSFNLTRHPDTKITNDALLVIYEVPETHNSDVFAKITRAYADALDEYFMTIYTLFMTQNEKLPLTRGKMWQGGHAQDQGVFEFRVSTAASKALQRIGDEQVVSFLKGSKTQVAVKLRAIMSKDVTHMKIFIESGKDNRADQSDVLKKKNQFVKSAEAAIARITKGKGFGSFKGSDSPEEAARKRTIKLITDPFKKIKGIKITTEDLKVISNGSGASLVVKRRITRSLVGTEKKERKGPRSTNSSVAGISTLLADINAKLHDAVKRNMGKDGSLNYVSGEFAKSVEVGHITATAAGFPRINYRYQFSPYSVFDFAHGKEPWNTPARDPDILIDKSIRDIVAGRLGQRFFTAKNFLSMK